MSFTMPFAPTQLYQQPNKISDLLIRMGETQAENQRRSGAIWGGALSNLGETIGNTITQIQKQKQQAPMLAAELADKQARTALNQQQVQAGQNDNRFSDVMANQQSMAGAGQALSPDAIAANLDANGLSQYKEKALKAFGDTQSAMKAQQDATTHALAVQADHLGDLVGTPLFDQGLSMAEQNLKVMGIPQGQAIIEQIKGMPQDQQKAMLKHVAGLSESYNKAKADEAKTNRVVVPEKSSLIDIGPDGKPTTLVSPLPEPPKPETRGIDVQAADALARGDKATYQRLIQVKKDMGQADDKPGAMKSVTVQDANGDTVMANYDGRTGKYFDTSGKEIKDPKKPLGATDSNRANAAQAVNATGNDLIAKLSDPQFKAVVGPLMGRATSLRELIGNPPPQFSEMAGEIESYALANMGVHGMRSVQGANQISKLLDAKHTPESLIAAIKGLQGYSNNYLATVGRGSKATNGAAPDKKANPFR